MSHDILPRANTEEKILRELDKNLYSAHDKSQAAPTEINVQFSRLFRLFRDVQQHADAGEGHK